MYKIILVLSIILLCQRGDIAQGMMEQSLPSSAAEERTEQINFKDINIEKKNGKFVITGKAKVKKGTFYYNVEDGHSRVIPEIKVRVNNLYWTSFKLTFSIPVEAMPYNGVLVLNLYEKNRFKEIRDHFPVFLESAREENKQS